MDWIKELNKNKDIVINDFKEYLEENYTEFYNNLDNFRFCKDFRSFGIELLVEQYMNNYITSLYYDIQDNTEDYAEQLNVENEISKILSEYLGINVKFDKED